MTNRRNFIKSAAAAGIAGILASKSAPAHAKGIQQWKMIMTWPKELPGLGAGATRLGRRIETLSGGRLEIRIFGAGELVPALECFDAVSSGNAELAHCPPYYWLNKSRAAAFFCAVPGGMTAYELNSWIYFGGGQQLWDKLYKPFGIRSFLAGNTGVQMGGWFKKPIESLKDIKGLKIRMPGLGGSVINALGGNAQTIPGAEVYSALQSGVIDAAEWVGPWNDLALGFHKIAQNYYGPGFHEGGPALELMVNNAAYDSLDKDLQQLIKVSAAAENQLMWAEYYANNLRSAEILRKKYDVKLQVYPDDVLKAFFKTSEEIVADVATDGVIEKEIYESYAKFRKASIGYGKVGEQGFLNGRMSI
jgi:TRAP-type mannitol/chloroaromatic compound transport system substrate-binding protein